MDPEKKLVDIIFASLRENSLEILDEYLSSLVNSSELLNGKLVVALIQILNRHGRHEEKALHVSSILKCLQHFVNTVTDTQKWERVSEDISKLCQAVFLISSSYIKQDALILRVIDVISALVSKVNNVVDDLLKFLVKDLIARTLCTTHTNNTRLQIMILIGSLLEKSSRGIRTEILPSTVNNLNDLSNFLCQSEDYETQVAVTEILSRCLMFIKKHQDSLFTKHPKIGALFKKYQPFINFDSNCRLFLNEVNESLGDKKKVFSVPCMVVCANDARLRKPNDPVYTDFWVDFNLGSKSVSFYYQPNNAETWDIMVVPQEKVLVAVAKDSACQSRSGEKIEAVKFEIFLDPSVLSSNAELPQRVKIYPRKDKFIELEPVIRNIFNKKFQNEVVHKGKSVEEAAANESRSQPLKQNEFRKEKSFMETSIQSKFLGDEQQEIKNTTDKSKSHSLLTSEESDVEEEENGEEDVEGSPYGRFLKEKMLEEGKTNTQLNTPVGNKRDKVENSFEGSVKESVLYVQKKPEREDINSKLVQSNKDDTNERIPESTKSPCGAGRSSSIKPLDTGLVMHEKAKKGDSSVIGSMTKAVNLKKRVNISKLNSNSKKRRLYSFEKSDAENIVMSSQDLELSVEIPSYKFTKKETYVKPQSNINRENVSFSYIKNREKGESANNKNEQKSEYVFEQNTITHKCSNEEDNTESSCEPSPHNLFKDLPTKRTVSPKIQPKEKKFFSNKTEKKVGLSKAPESQQEINWLNTKSVYSDLGSSEKEKPLRCNSTYGRSKPKKPWRRLRALSTDSSDSDSEYVPPAKLLKENNQPLKQPPKKTRFAACLVKDKIDPIRDNVFMHEMELEPSNDFEEPTMKPREVVVEPPTTKGKKDTKKSARGKNTNKITKQTAKQTNNRNKKKPEPKKTEQQCSLEKQSEDLTSCMDIVHYEPPEGDIAFDCEDLALEILSGNEVQNTLHPQTTFKVNDMVKFGKSLMSQVQEKVKKAESLAQKEREMNFAAFDYKIQSACNCLYGNSQKLESVTDKLEKLRTMLEASYKLHKDVSNQINMEVSNIEETKNELMKNINKIKKTESLSIYNILQGFGGYMKKLVLSFVQGNSTRNAITN